MPFDAEGGQSARPTFRQRRHAKAVLQIAYPGSRISGGQRRTGASCVWVSRRDVYDYDIDGETEADYLGPAVASFPGTSEQYEQLDTAWILAFAQQCAQERDLMLKATAELERQQIRALLDFSLEDVCI
jgi:hypothetical protein